MSKKKKQYTAEQTKQYEARYKKQSFKQSEGEKYEWVDITFYMMDHKSFKELSVYATKLYLYMRQWAYRNEEWKKTGIFPYAQSMMSRLGIMSISQTKRALNELWEKGFLDKHEYGVGGVARWSFSNRWYIGGKQEF
ncbi:MAG: hypothetical protein PHR96_05200 [Clostridia bacterium]|jgi:hypothetical protein|nr:hypothetical protein [Clostridia bacterium]